MNRLFQGFSEENVGEFKLLAFSKLRGSGIWLGKILANDICSANFLPKFSPATVLRYMVLILLQCRGTYVPYMYVQLLTDEVKLIHFNKETFTLYSIYYH